MIEPTVTNRISDPARGWSPPCDNTGDRVHLLYLLRQVLECLDVIGTREGLPPDSPDEELNRWEDESYVYLEARVDGQAPESIIDLNAADGMVFVRISR